ncbi:MAG: DUF4340 domain-containing protein, partial [Thiotrichales bacterium]|nr:DUF4340 domain-containing protein [Thiotrichales bacterium]
MRSRLLINLVLLLFIVAAVLFLSFTETNDEAVAPVLLSDTDPDQITSIIIQRRDKDEVRFEKHDGGWQMQAPYRARAHQTRIDAMLRLLSAGSAAALAVAQLDLANLKLDAPDVVLKLNNEEFAFGDINPLDKKRYVLYEDKVHLIHDTLHPQLTTSATFYIDPLVIPETESIQQVQYPQFRLLKQDGRWALRTGLDIADEQVQLLGRSWQQLRASAVQAYTGMEALYEIAVDLASGQTIRLMVTADLPDLIL